MGRYRMFVDEVGDHSFKSLNDPVNKYLSLTGVIVKQDYASRVLYPEFEKLKSKYFESHCSATPVIFHRTDIVSKRNAFKSLLDPSIEQDFNLDMLNLLSELEYEVINVLIDKKKYQAKYLTWTYDTYHYCLRCLLERYQKYLQNKNAVGDIIFESRSPQADRKLSASYYRIYSKGTEYIKSEDFKKTLSSQELKLSKKKDNLAGIQLADLLSYAARRYMLDFFEIERIANFTFNDIIIESVLKDKLRRHNGKVNGYGIKLLP